MLLAWLLLGWEMIKAASVVVSGVAPISNAAASDPPVACVTSSSGRCF